MNTKKYKHLEDVLDDYLTLSEEQNELPAIIQKSTDKFKQHLSVEFSSVYKTKESEDLYRIFSQIKKHADRKSELELEMNEVENTIKEFLSYIKGGKITYDTKDDNDKSRITFLFWLEDGRIKSERA